MWIVVGFVESRSGDVEIMPAWAIGSPNSFASQQDANTVRDAMQSHIERSKAERVAASPGVGGGGPAIRYVVLPAIDDSLIRQLHGGAPASAPAPAAPSLSFSQQTAKA